MEILLFKDTIPRVILDGIQIVHQHVFEGGLLKEQKLIGKSHLLAVVSLEDEVITGFKLGYEQEEGVFYSWLGGVHPDFQQRGIAVRLMDVQHSWCKEQGYSRVRTYGRNERKAMLIVNLKANFNIVSTFMDDKGRHKIAFEKTLN